MPTYQRLQQYAIAISIVSILYNSAEGAVSIVLGSESSSRSLVFFGVQSGIEVVSAAIVLWRFRKIAKPGEEDALQISDANLRVERLGTWSIAILIGILALATEATAIYGLATHAEPNTSNASLIVSVSALVLMVLIWLPKRTLARRLNSSTMSGEATCSLSCIQITIVLFVGSLVFRLWHGGWWVDNATALVLGLLFAREAWKMIRWVRDPEFRGGCCGKCATRAEKDVEELVEQYRDICECCNEKEVCRTADACKCESDDSAGVSEEACCVGASGEEQCCTRELRQGPRPQPPQSEAGQERGCHDTCCSSDNADTPPATDRRSTAEKTEGEGSRPCQKGCCSV